MAIKVMSCKSMHDYRVAAGGRSIDIDITQKDADPGGNIALVDSNGAITAGDRGSNAASSSPSRRRRCCAAVWLPGDRFESAEPLALI
jgi:hypothetical protein